MLHLIFNVVCPLNSTPNRASYPVHNILLLCCFVLVSVPGNHPLLLPCSGLSPYATELQLQKTTGRRQPSRPGVV